MATSLVSIAAWLTLLHRCHCAEKPYLKYNLRPDGAPVVLLPVGALEAEFSNTNLTNYPFKSFSSDYVQRANSGAVDWHALGYVTSAKDQKSTPFCGTFARLAVAETQYNRKYGAHESFSVEEMVDCIGWTGDQPSYWQPHGFQSWDSYPFTGNDDKQTCRYDTSKVLPQTEDGRFTATIQVPDEDQNVAFIHRNGPVITGIYADVFSKRESGCDQRGDCFITSAMCNQADVKGKSVNHAITLVGYGEDSAHGPYWHIKNSWGTGWANSGFIKLARGIKCAGVGGGRVFTYGAPDFYFEDKFTWRQSNKIWSDAACKNIGYQGGSLSECQQTCYRKPSCTAFNFWHDGGCYLRACDPHDTPTSTQSGWTSYAAYQWKFHVNVWSDSECSNVGYHSGDLASCQQACLSKDGCNGFNIYDSGGCYLRSGCDENAAPANELDGCSSYILTKVPINEDTATHATMQKRTFQDMSSTPFPGQEVIV